MQSISKSKNSSFFLKGSENIGVLLLHGWTSSPDDFLPLAKYLNSFGYTVSVPLLTGHGTKPEDLEGVTWHDWLRDSRKALEELKKYANEIFVGGISMGGNLAMLISKDASVAGIIVMGAATKYRFHNLAKQALFLMGLTKTYRKKYYPPWVRKKMGKRKGYSYYPIESAKTAVGLAEETRKYLPKIKKPILIMQSTTDHMVSKKMPRMIFNGVKSETKEIFWIENAYHVFAGERKVWKKIGEFIDKISKS